MPDEEFQLTLKAVKAGDDAAWRDVVQHYSGPLLAYIRRVGSGDAEDALAEVWVSAARTVQSFEGDEPSFRSWLFVIAHRRAIDEGRKAGRRPIPVDSVPDEADPFGLTPEMGVIEEAVGSDRIQVLLDRLTEDQRAVVLLRVLGDLSLEETASILGKRVGAVKALQRRAFTNLRKIFETDPFPF